MSVGSKNNTDESLTPKVKFGITIAVMLAVGAGHLFVIRGLSDVVLGLPLWIWVQAGVFVVMIVMADYATRQVIREVA